MPQFETVTLQEAKLKTTTGRTARYASQYIEYIQQLTDGQAGKLQATEDEKITTIRRRLTIAANLLGKELTIKRMGDEIYFWIEPSDQEKPTRRPRRQSQDAQPSDDTD